MDKQPAYVVCQASPSAVCICVAHTQVCIGLGYSTILSAWEIAYINQGELDTLRYVSITLTHN